MQAAFCQHAGSVHLSGGMPQRAPVAVEHRQHQLIARRCSLTRISAVSGDDAPQSRAAPDLASAPHFGASMPPQKHQKPATEPTADAHELAGWQRKRLESAYQAGKRSISVKQLAGDTKLDRKQVLAWLKQRAQQPDTPADRDIASHETADSPFSQEEQPVAVVDPPTTTAKLSFAERQAMPGGDFARKRMKRSTEMTLEKVFDRYRWPPDDVIAGICMLHREMSPGRVKLWFEEQRRLDTRPQPSSHRHSNR